MPVLLKANNFKAEVLQSKLPVLVDFYAAQCPACRLLQPILQELAEEYADELKVCMCSIDQLPDESDKAYKKKFRTILSYGVLQLPTVLVFAQGKLRRKLPGLHSKEELLQLLAEEGLLQEA